VLAAAANAQGTTGTISVVGPAGNPVSEGTPRFTITTAGFTAAEQPLQLRLQVALSSNFTAPLFADTTVNGTSAQITIPRILPPQVTIWWRAIAKTAQGTLVATNADGPHATLPWLTLTAPNQPSGTTVTTRTPTFEWQSAGLYPPVAPWHYRLSIARESDGTVIFTHEADDTSRSARAHANTYTSEITLETNTPYFWAISATASTTDSIRVVSSASFVVLSADAPIATVLYQSFPSPFPTPLRDRTCIWIDLRRTSDVSLEVRDIRGNHVAKILPGRGVTIGATLPAGRWGRSQANGDQSCDDRFSWDGTDDAGRTVKPGVYLIVFKGDGVTSSRKVLFRGK
jgi:hypothetical protein